MEEITIELVSEYNEELHEAINKLVSQLTNNVQELSRADVISMIETSRFFVAKDLVANKIIGMVMVKIYRIPSAKKAILEEIVVDENYRRKGIGTLLMERAIQEAGEAGVSFIDLTSNPSRVVADKMYQGFKFEKRETNVYRLNL